MTRNTWIGLFLAGLLLTACRGNTFKIKGITEGIDYGDTLFATMDFDTGLPFDTIIVKDGKFTMEGRADSVRRCIIYRANDVETSALVFLEPGLIEVKLSLADSETRVSGTKINEAWQQLKDSVEIYGNLMNRLLLQYYSEDVTEKEKTKILAKITKHSNVINKCICKVTEENIDNELGYFLILDGSMAEQDRLRLIGLLPNAVRERKAIKELLNDLMSQDRDMEDLDFFEEPDSFAESFTTDFDDSFPN